MKALRAIPLMLFFLICPDQKQNPDATVARHGKPAGGGLFQRRYVEGEKLVYHMKGINEDWRYEIDAIGVVKKDSAGHFFEEYSWSNLRDNRPGSSLPAAVSSFRQVVSLDPAGPMTVPDLSQVIMIVGPITDFLTFYADLRLAAISSLNHAGDHSYVKIGRPNSWADGAYVLLGQDSIDFGLTLKQVDPKNQIAILVVRHVPPEKPKVNLPVPWMNTNVADTPNNWVEVKERADGDYIAAVGKETFDVEIKLSLANGKILGATMDNPIEVSERKCADRDLTRCSEARRYQIRRQIELTLVDSSTTR